MVEINFAVVTTIVGFTGILVGAYMNQRLSNKFARKDLIFKKKLEYFEKISEAIEGNIRVYRNSINEIKNNKKMETKNILENMKEKRRHFFVLSSPLYFNTLRLSQKIKEFVRIESEIFWNFSNMVYINNKNKEEIIKRLENGLEELKIKSLNILLEMRGELKNS